MQKKAGSRVPLLGIKHTYVILTLDKRRNALFKQMFCAAAVCFLLTPSERPTFRLTLMPFFSCNVGQGVLVRWSGVFLISLTLQFSEIILFTYSTFGAASNAVPSEAGPNSGSLGFDP